MDAWVWYLIGSVPLAIGGAVLMVAAIRWTRRPSTVDPSTLRAGEPEPDDPNSAARRAIGKSSWTLIGGGGV